MRIHCSGIGGIGLSAYAALMHSRGHSVSGSDPSSSATTSALSAMGIHVTQAQDGSAITDDLDLLVYSEAVPVDAPERRIAAEKGIRSLSYFGALGAMTKEAAKTLISVAGTHGKSSTTAMIARMCIDCGLNPSVVVGTKMTELLGRNWRSGSDVWVVESCEYTRSFLHLSPHIIVLTTVDGDHFDAFRDMDDYRRAFTEFIEKLPVDGVIIGHGTDPNIRSLLMGQTRRFIDADTEQEISLSTPGRHMRENAKLALALSRHLGIPYEKARSSLEGFAGTWRRMERRGVMESGAVIIDDYAHHPAEIRATLQAMREAYPSQKILCVFQPHTHDRTLKLWDDFCRSFRDADAILTTDIYDARPGRDAAKADPARFASSLADRNQRPARHVPTLLDAEAFIRDAYSSREWIIITMGAGSITKLADALVSGDTKVISSGR